MKQEERGRDTAKDRQRDGDREKGKYIHCMKFFVC